MQVSLFAKISNFYITPEQNTILTWSFWQWWNMIKRNNRDHPESKSLQKRAPTVFDGLTKSPLSRFEGVLAKAFLFKKMFRKLLLVKIKKTDIFCKTYLQEFTLLCSSVLAWNIQLPSQQHAWMLRRTFANSRRFSLTKIPRLEPRARLSRITWRKGKRIKGKLGEFKGKSITSVRPRDNFISPTCDQLLFDSCIVYLLV